MSARSNQRHKALANPDYQKRELCHSRYKLRGSGPTPPTSGYIDEVNTDFMNFQVRTNA
jgi:hypothetical protein